LFGKRSINNYWIGNRKFFYFFFFFFFGITTCKTGQGYQAREHDYFLHDIKMVLNDTAWNREIPLNIE
jgi:hypothetical protein